MKLTYSKRQRLPDEAFAIPEKRQYPIPDIDHARNALARVSQFGSPQQQTKVREAVYAKYPQLSNEYVFLKNGKSRSV